MKTIEEERRLTVVVKRGRGQGKFIVEGEKVGRGHGRRLAERRAIEE